DPDSQYGGTHHRTRSRCFWNQHFTRAGRYGKSRAETGRLSQARPNAAGGIHFFRSSERSRANPHGHGLESGKLASGRISGVRKLFNISLSQCRASHRDRKSFAELNLKASVSLRLAFIGIASEMHAPLQLDWFLRFFNDFLKARIVAQRIPPR